LGRMSFKIWAWT